MKDILSRSIGMCTVVVVAQRFAPPALAKTPDSAAALQARVRELEKTQQRLLEKMRKTREARTAAPAIIEEGLSREREELDKRGRELESALLPRTRLTCTSPQPPLPPQKCAPTMRA